MPDFFIEFATPKDVDSIVQMIRDLAEFEKMPEHCHVTTEHIRRAVFEEQLVRVIMARSRDDEGNVDTAGFALFFYNFSTWTGVKGLHLEDLYVRPEYRGRGLGRSMLRHLAKLANDEGCQRFEWNVLDWNVNAIALYESFGATLLHDWRICRLDGPALKAYGSIKE